MGCIKQELIKITLDANRGDGRALGEKNGIMWEKF